MRAPSGGRFLPSTDRYRLPRKTPTNPEGNLEAGRRAPPTPARCTARHGVALPPATSLYEHHGTPTRTPVTPNFPVKKSGGPSRSPPCAARHRDAGRRSFGGRQEV